MLSDSRPLCDVDFATGPLDDGADQICFDVTEPGTAHGIVAWFELDLGAGITLCNSVEHPASHWMQAFVPFPEPIGVSRGDAVVSEVRWHTNRIFAEQPRVSAS
jgi:type II protein arginine methyltransferase